MTLEVAIVTLPSAYATAFVNNDWSGLEGRDRRRAAAIILLFRKHGWSIVSTVGDQEPSFSWYYRLHGGICQGGDVLDYVVHKS